MEKFCSSLTEAANRFKLQGACFAGNRNISEGQLDVVSF
jgi:hypothetical protein